MLVEVDHARVCFVKLILPCWIVPGMKNNDGHGLHVLHHLECDVDHVLAYVIYLCDLDHPQKLLPQL